MPEGQANERQPLLDESSNAATPSNATPGPSNAALPVPEQEHVSTRMSAAVALLNARTSALLQPVRHALSPYLNHVLVMSKVRAMAGAFVAASLVALFIPALYYVYIPQRLQGGAKEPAPLTLHALHITSVTGSAVAFKLNATRGVNEAPPIQLITSPTRFSIVHLEAETIPLPIPARPWYRPHSIPSSWTEDDADFGISSDIVAGFDFQGLVVEAGATYANISIDSQLDALNNTFWSPFITDTVKYLVQRYNYEQNVSSIPSDMPSAPRPVTLRQQSLPTQWFPFIGFWKWNIPMWEYFRIDLAAIPTLFGDVPSSSPTFLEKLNLTLSEPVSVDQVPVSVPGSPLPVLIYVVNASFDFTNPTDNVLRVDETGLKLHAVISHRGVEMLRVWIQIPVIAHDRNVRALHIHAESIAGNGGTVALMEWFGLYAEGVDTKVQVHSIGFDYAIRLDDGRLGWIEDMVRSWVLDVFVKGAVEEDDWMAKVQRTQLRR
ncbi:hypothetical protein HDU77_008882 [Chytriomyces hyalinus]|nr:hypothetical protein HDU77_008882 [Chytriomyces hyalinus]